MLYEVITHRRRDEAPGRAGQGALPGALGSRAGDHPARAQGAPDQRAADRILAVEPGRGDRDPAAVPRAP